MTFYRKEYYLKNKERIKRQIKEYKLRNKEKIKAYYFKNKEHIKEYYLKNRDHIEKRRKERDFENRDKLNRQKREWSLKNIEHVKEYYLKNKERIKENHSRNRKYINDYVSKKYHTDPNFKLRLLISRRVRQALKGKDKSAHTMELIGCTIDELWVHLESQFKPWMRRDNHGLWHIDHIKACSKFDLTDPVQQRACFHWSNLQPLWAHENLSKGRK